MQVLEAIAQIRSQQRSLIATVVLGVLLAALIAMLLSWRLRRWLRLLLGQRWVFVLGSCDYIARITRYRDEWRVVTAPREEGLSAVLEVNLPGAPLAARGSASRTSAREPWQRSPRACRGGRNGLWLALVAGACRKLGRRDASECCWSNLPHSSSAAAPCPSHARVGDGRSGKPYGWRWLATAADGCSGSQGCGRSFQVLGCTGDHSATGDMRGLRDGASGG